MTPRARRLAAAIATLALLGLGVAGCASDDSGSSASSSDSGGDRSEVAPAATPEKARAGGADAAADAPQAQSVDAGSVSDSGALVDTAGQGAPAENTAAVVEPGDARSLIKTGNVALRATDVRTALFEISKVVQATRSEVAEENTEADDKGEPERSLLTVRVPVGQFATALTDLKNLGKEQEGVDLIDSSSSSEDVSTQVIDTDVRVELQKRSIERISVLLDRATSIRDIVSIERELARREADLGSLQKRQTFLADQTSLSTITVSVERPAKKTAVQEKKDKDDSGFFTGLSHGWDAFENVTTGLLTSIGALLPFAILALLVGIPLRVWMRRRQPATRSTADAAAPITV
jgi:hypothetical protein